MYKIRSCLILELLRFDSFLAPTHVVIHFVDILTDSLDKVCSKSYPKLLGALYLLTFRTKSKENPNNGYQ